MSELASVEEIAARFGVSVNTVRQHIKAVFAKTGMTRQSQIAALVAGVPRLGFKPIDQ